MKIARVFQFIVKVLTDCLLQLQKLHFYLFDQYILYPLMRKIAKTYQIEFLNLGYAPKRGEENSFGEVLEEEEEETHLPLKYHYFLYEKALSLCPLYKEFDGIRLLDVGCGVGGGIKWLKRLNTLKWFKSPLF